MKDFSTEASTDTYVDNDESKKIPTSSSGGFLPTVQGTSVDSGDGSEEALSPATRGRRQSWTETALSARRNSLGELADLFEVGAPLSTNSPPDSRSTSSAGTSPRAGRAIHGPPSRSPHEDPTTDPVSRSSPSLSFSHIRPLPVDTKRSSGTSSSSTSAVSLGGASSEGSSGSGGTSPLVLNSPYTSFAFTPFHSPPSPRTPPRLQDMPAPGTLTKSQSVNAFDSGLIDGGGARGACSPSVGGGGGGVGFMRHAPDHEGSMVDPAAERLRLTSMEKQDSMKGGRAGSFQSTGSDFPESFDTGAPSPFSSSQLASEKSSRFGLDVSSPPENAAVASEPLSSASIPEPTSVPPPEFPLGDPLPATAGLNSPQTAAEPPSYSPSSSSRSSPPAALSPPTPTGARQRRGRAFSEMRHRSPPIPVEPALSPRTPGGSVLPSSPAGPPTPVGEGVGAGAVTTWGSWTGGSSNANSSSNSGIDGSGGCGGGGGGGAQQETHGKVGRAGAPFPLLTRGGRSASLASVAFTSPSGLGVIKEPLDPGGVARDEGTPLPSYDNAPNSPLLGSSDSYPSSLLPSREFSLEPQHSPPSQQFEQELQYGSPPSLSSQRFRFGRSASVDENAAESFEGKYIVTGGLGVGGYSIVVMVEDTETGDPFAMKVTLKSRMKRSRDRRRLRNELKVMQELAPSPFLERCHAAFESPTRLFFVLDYNAGGDLFYHLVQRVKATSCGFTERECCTLLAELVLALEHLHGLGFVHRDIKVENIMLSREGHVKLIDFGLASEIKEAEVQLSPTGSLIYMAPELLKDTIGGFFTDWWAVGVLAHELLTGRTPWSSLTDKALIQREIASMRVAPPGAVSPAAGKFVCGLLHQDRARRLGTSSSHEVRHASFFKAIDWAVAERVGLPPALGREATQVRNGNGTGHAGAFNREDCDAILEKYVTGGETEVEDAGDPTNDLTLGLPSVVYSPSVGLSVRQRSESGPNAAEEEGLYDWDDDDGSNRRKASVDGFSGSFGGSGGWDRPRQPPSGGQRRSDRNADDQLEFW